MFTAELAAVARTADIKLTTPLKKAILTKPSERDPTAAVCLARWGGPTPDPQLGHIERVPLPDSDDPADALGIPVREQDFFDREVRPHTLGIRRSHHPVEPAA